MAHQDLKIIRWNQKFLDYEIETPTVAQGGLFQTISWNQKFLDYEIETEKIRQLSRKCCALCWNQKFLDYEIETNCTGLSSPPRTFDGWNQKFLDYEIETGMYLLNQVLWITKVGIKSFSITRLKRRQSHSLPVSLLVGIKSFSITRLKLPRSSQPEHRVSPKLESKVSRLRD